MVLARSFLRPKAGCWGPCHLEGPLPRGSHPCLSGQRRPLAGGLWVPAPRRPLRGLLGCPQDVAAASPGRTGKPHTSLPARPPRERRATHSRPPLRRRRWGSSFRGRRVEESGDLFQPPQSPFLWPSLNVHCEVTDVPHISPLSVFHTLRGTAHSLYCPLHWDMGFCLCSLLAPSA